MKDSQTGKAKGRKKNHKLPRATIEDIELRIHMTEQLAFSNSVDAAREADEQARGLAAFLDNLDKDPKVFESLRKRIELCEKRLAKIENNSRSTPFRNASNWARNCPTSRRTT